MSEGLIRKPPVKNAVRRLELLDATACPDCGADGIVRQSQIPLRNRICPECGCRWRTLEVLYSAVLSRKEEKPELVST